MAAWAEKYGRTIKAALLVAPADTEKIDFPAKAVGFSPMCLQKLSFPSIVVASTNDEYVSLARSSYFAQCWGSKFVNIGAMGHINSATNLKDWPQGLQLLYSLDQNL
jgi:predicted alpha/beta hydrolase family esterase